MKESLATRAPLPTATSRSTFPAPTCPVYAPSRAQFTTPRGMPHPRPVLDFASRSIDTCCDRTGHHIACDCHTLWQGRVRPTCAMEVQYLGTCSRPPRPRDRSARWSRRREESEEGEN
eukprot:1965337-Rhodomonas_salina.1